MQKAVKMSLKGKTSGNGQIDRIFMILKKKLTWGGGGGGGMLTLPWSYYIHLICILYITKLLVYISDFR